MHDAEKLLRRRFDDTRISALDTFAKELNHTV